MSSIAPAAGGCAFTLDVQWILDIVDKVKKVAGDINRMVQNVIGVAQRFLESLSGIISWFCWIPGVGRFAKKLVEQACAVIKSTASAITAGIQTSLEMFKHVLAPWEVRSAGKSIADQLAPKCEEFALRYEKGRFRSVESWTGEAADSFFSSIASQQEAARDAAEGAKQFGEAVHEMGAKGVEITITFVTQYITAAVGIITAAIELAAVPVGTAIGAAQILGLIGAIVTYVMVWVNAMLGMISSMSAMSNAAHQAVQDGWPIAVV